MNYIYAVVFSNNIVKFGRTTNLIRRVNEHYTVARHHGVTVIKVVTGMVYDARREEQAILDAAYQNMDEVSTESFEYSDYDQITRSFDDIRLPYIEFDVGFRPFCLTVGGKGGSATKSTRKSRCIDAICDILSSGPSKFQQIRDRMMDFSPKEISASLTELRSDGVVERKNSIDIWTRCEIDDIKRASFRLKSVE